MSPMKRLFKVGKWTFYWAGQRFVQPGVWVFAFGDNRRILPWIKK